MTKEMNPTYSILNKLIGVCVDCRSDLTPRKAGGFTCQGCKRNFKVSNDGIILMSPKDKGHQLAAYDSDVFQGWLKVWPTEIKNWSIYRNKLFRFISIENRPIRSFNPTTRGRNTHH